MKPLKITAMLHLKAVFPKRVGLMPHPKNNLQGGHEMPASLSKIKKCR
jgi:hypothetical protein